MKREGVRGARARVGGGGAFTVVLATLLVCGQLAPGAAIGEEENAVEEALTAYMDFTDYQGGNLLPEQIPAEDWPGLHVVDARLPQDYASGHIPGAVNIEWRRLVARRDELPANATVLLYCNTGSLSAQGALALKVLGHENVKILTGGYDEWRLKGGFDAHARATEGR